MNSDRHIVARLDALRGTSRVTLVLASIAVAIGLYLFLAGFHDQALEKATASWPTVPGVVVSSTVEHGVFNSEVQVAYEYVVGGVTFSSNHSANVQGTMFSRSTSDLVDSTYAPGATVLVHYIPSAPGFAVLEAGAGRSAYNKSYVGGFIMLGALMLAAPVLFVLRRKRMKLLAPPAASQPPLVVQSAGVRPPN